MNFTEPHFLFLFLPIFLLLYYLSPRRGKNALLLAASILFYGFGEGYYTAVIVFSIVYNYFAGHVIDGAQEQGRRKLMLAGAVAVNLGVLVAFKYTPFIVDNLDLVLRGVGIRAIPHPRTHLPLGISFFTFHALSYITDVYRREVTPMRKFHSFALYITLFPQLVAGPIIRYKTICDQFALEGPNSRRHSVEAFAYGVRRFVIGLGKKMLVADVVAVAADGIFATPHASMTPAAAWLGVLCYTLQIYFDFSGYSDMAIGLGHMFGFEFPENFDYPYIARSVTDFWRRWHMSLSTWFRDYLYIPLGGNRISPRRTYINLLIVFFLCGFWHGAAWNFIFWGLYFGLFLIVERVGFGKWLARRPRILQHAYLILIMMVGWVFFRAPDLTYAFEYLQRMAFLGPPAGAGGAAYVPANIFTNRLMLLVIVAGVIGSTPWLPEMQRAWDRLTAGRSGVPGILATTAARSFELAALAALFVTSASLAANGTYSPFIYFRF